MEVIDLTNEIEPKPKAKPRAKSRAKPLEPVVTEDQVVVEPITPKPKTNSSRTQTTSQNESNIKSQTN